jgi:adenine-specific DNA-methyltransferase
MAKRKKTEKHIEQYEHSDKKRANNPPVGLVTPKSDPDTGKKKTYEYDPHLDPQLQWAGKAEHTSFEVPTVSLHVHERIDPKTIIDTVTKEKAGPAQMSLFKTEQKPLREAIDFYKHKEGWSNRLIAGDSLLVMNSLLEKEGMAGKVQMVYFDPPYGIKYGSNFQPFVNKRDVTDGKDEDLSAEPEMIKAFRDTWELGIHSYLTYLRDRLLLVREMLHESGSVFVQISDDNVHFVRCLMEEIFGVENFIAQIAFQTTPYATSNYLAPVYDTLVWFGKEKKAIKYNQLFLPKENLKNINAYKYIESPDGENYRTLTSEEISHPELIQDGWKRFQSTSLISQGASASPQEFEFEGKKWLPPSNSHWKTTINGMKQAEAVGRIFSTKNSLRFKSYLTDFPVTIIHNIWTDMITGSFTESKKYVVQTNPLVIQRCLLMSTDPGDIVLDITCGSGTTATVAEQWGRRWITCDTSRVALTLAKQRLMTANFDYYTLAHPDQGVGSGFEYKTVPHITLKSIANNEPPATETLYDQPFKDSKKSRITGPFTVEAVPAPYAKSFDELEQEDCGSDTSIARTGETHRQSEWRDELLRTGVRAKGGKIIQFSRVEPLSGTKFIQAEAETKEDIPKKVLVVFGPEHAPLEQRQVEDAWQEARALNPDSWWVSLM